MKLPPREMKRARIEIIPMIDAIFFLLVFFMIASLNEARMRAIALALPRSAAPAPNAAAASGPGQPGGNLILTMTDSGEYTLGTRRLGTDSAAVQNALTRVLKTTPPRSVVLNFTGTQSTQSLISVLDLLNRARTATGRDVPVLIATEPIDANGHALRPTERPNP